MKLDLRTGRIEPNPSPTPYDLARAITRNMGIHLDRLDRLSQQRWIEVAARTLRDLNL
jgi:hypothetical protein